MKKTVLLVAVTAAFAATPALAQDESSFSGAYVGGYVGYDHVVLKDNASNTSGGKDGVAFGAIAGYDVDLGSAVVGIEGEVGDSSVNQTATDLIVVGDSGKLSSNLDLYAGGRVGFRAGSNVLIYAKGGYASTRVKLDYTSGATTTSGSDTLSGFRVGAGMQYNMNRVGLRLEYRYTNYGDYSYQGVNTGLSANRHQVVVALVGRF